VSALSDDKESMEQLHERLRRLEAAVEATGIGLWEWDVRSGELTWNDRNRELLGVAHDRPLTIQDYPGVVHPDDLELVRTAYREAIEQPEGDMLVCEYRTAPAADGKSRWVQQRARVMKDAEGVARVVGATLDITDRKTAEERRSLVLRELAHRAKNGIMIMMTIVAQTARSARTVKDFEAVLTARLQSMVDSQDLVTQVAGRSLPLGDLLDRALTPFDPGRFDLEPGVREISISNDMVVALALLLHELSTNAVKYGALSAPSGRVKLGLGPAEAGKAVVTWTESGGPRVKPPKSRGFGSRLVDISLRNNGGFVEPRYDPNGFQADIHFPRGRA
jgi:PAS domain S-box-containing protein